MRQHTEVTRRLGLRHPLVQGPFGGGLSSVALVAAVGEAGGLGSYGAHHLSPEDILRLGVDLKRATGRPFALNLWVSRADPGASSPDPRSMARTRGALARARARARLGPGEGLEESEEPWRPDPWTFADQAAAVIEAGPAVFSFVFGIPDQDILATCRRRGIQTVGAATTVDEAEALAAAGVDLVLATGCEAGGHRPSFLRPAEESLVGTMALVPQVAARLKIPVLAAGGVADGRGVAAALALGAAGVQVGTAFLACDESGASPAHREYLRQGDTTRTRLSRCFTGRLARFVENDLLRALEAEAGEPLPYPLPAWLIGPLKRAAAELGRPDLMPLYAGQGAPLIRHMRAADLMDELASGVPD